MTNNTARSLYVALGLFLASNLLGDVLDHEILVLVKQGSIVMPLDESLATLGEIQADSEVVSVLEAIRTQGVRRAMPAFGREDTLRFSPDGDTARLPDFSNLFALRLSDDVDRDSAIALVGSLLQVTYAEKNQRGEPFQVRPIDTYYETHQWSLNATTLNGGTPGADIHAPLAWQYATGNNLVVLGMVETRPDWSHPDLAGKLLGDHHAPAEIHPTHVAGIMAAAGNNGIGICGVDWNAKINTQDVVNWDLPNVVQAVIDAGDAGCAAINCSWGLSGYSPSLYSAFTRAFQMGALMVAAGPETPPKNGPYPNRFGPWMLTVTASNTLDQIASYSQPCRLADVAAPGGEVDAPEHRIWSTLPVEYGSYGHLVGTSMAAPHAAGVAGLLVAANSSLKNYDLEWAIKLGADDKGSPGWDQYYGYGRLNALNALRLVRPPHEITRGTTPPLSLHSSEQRRDFAAEPCPGVAAGPYICDVYVEQVTVSHSYLEPPLGWFSLTGYSLDQPNSGEEYLAREANGNSITLRTYFYWIVSDMLGRAINRWAPVDPHLVPAQYTLVGRKAFAGSSGFEDHDPLPYENLADFSSGTADWQTKVIGSENGIYPPSGSRMYKFTGSDDNSGSPRNDYLSSRLFDCNPPFAITDRTFLSYWTYVRESPGGLGHITVDGLTSSGVPLRDWSTWGIVIDTSSQAIHPAGHTVPEGRWVHCVFSLGPAAGQTLQSLSVIYDDGDPSEAGPFTAYIDDVQITGEFPVKDRWYPEVFGNGADPNFALGIYYDDYDHNPIADGARIVVDGRGGGSQNWYRPSLRNDLSQPVSIVSNAWLMWRQFDLEHALQLELLVVDVYGATHPLIYSKNASNHWSETGWVNMGDPESHYGVWESFSRNVFDDYVAEYGSSSAPCEVRGFRIGHFCRDDWVGDKGGVVADIHLTSTPLVSQSPRMTAYANSPKLVSCQNEVHMVYTDNSSSYDPGIYYSSSPDGLHWGQPVHISSSCLTSPPALASDAIGNIYALWGYVASDWLHYVVSRRDPSGNWFDFTWLEYHGGDVDQLGHPPALLATDPSNLYLVVRSPWGQTDNCLMFYHYHRDGETWVRVEEFRISTAQSATHPSLNIDSQGNILVTYMDSQGAKLRCRTANGWQSEEPLPLAGFSPRSITSSRFQDTILVALHAVNQNFESRLLLVQGSPSPAPPYRVWSQVAAFPVGSKQATDSLCASLIGNTAVVFDSVDWSPDYYLYRTYRSIRGQDGVWQVPVPLGAPIRDARYPATCVHWNAMWPSPRLVIATTEAVGSSQSVIHTRLTDIPSSTPRNVALRINPGHPPSALNCTNVPIVILRTDAVDGLPFGADAVRFKQEYRASLTDSAPVVECSDWTSYQQEQLWHLNHGTGRYWITARYRVQSDGHEDTTIFAQDSIIFDQIAPTGAVALNRDRRFVNSPMGCTLTLTVSDGQNGSGVSMVRFAEQSMSLMQNPGFDSGVGGWQSHRANYDDSLKLVLLSAPADSADTLCFLEQTIPQEVLTPYWNAQARLTADIVCDSLATPGLMELAYRCQKSDTLLPGPETLDLVMSPAADVPTGYRSLTGQGSLNCAVSLFPPSPPVGYSLLGIVARIRFQRPFAGGRVWLDNFQFSITGGPGFEHANWEPFDTLKLVNLTGMPGEKQIHAQLQDSAGNESQELVSDSIVFDPIPPMAWFTFPNWGQVLVADTATAILGVAAEPVCAAAGDSGHFWYYKLTWGWMTSTGGCDSMYGILPESLFYEPRPMPPPDSLGFVQIPQLAEWNTKAITDQYGPGCYLLMLVALDSAGNQAQCEVGVYLDTGMTTMASGGAGSGAMAITTTPGNDLYVGTTTGQITQYTSELDSVQTITVQDSTGPAVITGLATDSFGAIYVGDTRDKSIKVCDEQGSPTDTIGNHTQLTAPNSVVLARNGDVWVADRIRNVIRVYDGNNNLKLSFGSTGNDTGQFLGAYALALGYLNVMNLETSVDSSGNPVTDTTITTQIRCLVADKGNHRIQVFDTAGHYLTSFGDSILSQPVALSIDNDNCCYVADQGNKAIFGFNPNGGLYLTIRGTSADSIRPIATTTSTDNSSLYALDQHTHDLVKYLVHYMDSTQIGGAQSGGTNPNRIPKELVLEQSRPNPAAGCLTIRYGIPRLTAVSLKVYDISGQLVRTLHNNDQLKPGYYSITWNCRDNRDRQVSNGVYFYRLVSNDKLKTTAKPTARIKTRKLVIAR